MSVIHPLFSLFLWFRSELTFEKLQDYVLHGPEYYYSWWITLIKENPRHVVIETILICFIIWLVFLRPTIDPKKESKTKLTQKEIDWLVETWKPEPLVPESSVDVYVPVRIWSS
jgi:hypothetical protein